MKLLLWVSWMSFTFYSINTNSAIAEAMRIEPPFEKVQAFSILQNKCNVCHVVKKKKRVFTLENMDRYKKKINRQVFKWKRMPKGNEIKLTPEEYTQLKTWINSPKNK